MSFLTLNDINWLEIITILLAILGSGFIFLLFWVHRRNNQQRFEELENKMHDQDTLVGTRIEEQFELFKQALQQHLSEVSTRIQSNEDHMNMLINQMDALRTALLEEQSMIQSEDEESENPSLDS